MKRVAFIAVGMAFIFCLQAQAAVEGRYVRIDTLVPAMENSELEVFSGGKNILLKHPEWLSCGEGWGWYGADANFGMRYKLVDGNVKTEQRGTSRPLDPGTSFATLEADLNATVPVEKIVFHVSRYDNPMIKKWFGDPEGWRVVSVLDADRKVVYSQLVTVYTPEYKKSKGVMTVEPKAGGPFVGRQVLPQSRSWFSLGEFLIEYLGVKPSAAPETEGFAERQAEFAGRNSAESAQAFSKHFFGEINLRKPELAEVRKLVEAGKHAEAMEVYKRCFLKKLEYFDTVIPTGGLYQFTADRCSGAIMAAEDMLHNRRVDRKAQSVSLVKPAAELDFSASLTPWNEMHPRCLLQAYAATGEKKYLNRWAQLLDEHSIFFQRWADGGDRRDYWPLRQIGDFVKMMRDLYETQKMRPGFIDDLPALTLARFLDLYAEEAPPVYWRLARRTVFNHQYNIWGGAYFTSKILDDFYVGERMQREMEDHFERLWTLLLARDGSMIEVADAGHVPCPLGTPAYRYFQMKRDKPEWFTSDLESYFLHNYLTAARYTIRFIAPDGVEHRSGKESDTYCFERVRQLLLREPGERYPEPFLSVYTDSPGADHLAGLIMREPEARAVVDTVYGRGRKREELSKRLQKCYDIATRRMPGGYQGEPKMLSDYMPYSGIHIMRRDWSADASFIEMVCQPPGGSANDRYMDTLGENWWGSDFWDTQFHYRDFGEALLLSRPLRVDGMNQCQSYETRGWKPGSKTERLVEAPELPLQNRFHCSDRFGYQECFYAGAYQNWDLEYSDPPNPRKQLKISGTAVTNVYATRQIFQLRRERLFVVVDRVRFSDTDEHELSERLLMLPVDDKAKVESDANKGVIKLVRPEGAQLTLHHFGVDGLSYETLKPIKERNYMRAKWSAKNESVLITLMEARRSPDDEGRIKEISEVSSDEETGFDAVTRDGEEIAFRVPLNCGGSYAEPESDRATVVVQGSDGSWSGLALGSDTVALGRKMRKLDLRDYEFKFDKREKIVEVSPVLRPINPPQFLPERDVFTDKLEVKIVSKTPGVKIYYTTDGSEPTLNAKLYTAPFTIKESCMVQARAFRDGVEKVPFTTEGTKVSDISFARFRKEAMLRASKSGGTKPGLAYEYMEERWMRLFGSADRLPAKSSGEVYSLMDVGMRETDGPFAVRYKGYISLSESGVYTFHAPHEYAHNGCEPGYDLRLYIDGREWRPGQMWHGIGRWSVALAKGAHRFQVVYADARAKDIEQQRVDYWWGYPTPWVVWRGVAPVIEISGPGVTKQPIPDAWLTH